MKKILLSLLTVLVAISANAQVVFDFDNNYQTYFPDLKGVSSGSNDTYVADGEFANDEVVTVDGVTITIKASAADAKTRNRVWASSPRLRMYNESFSVAAPGHKVTKIVFGAGSNFNTSTTVGTLVDKEWVGSAETVEFAVAKNTQIKTITVTVDGAEETPSTPVDISNTPQTAYTTSQAIDLIDADKGLDTKVYVKGTITKVDEISTSYGNATYWITDGKKELEIFRGYTLGGEKFTSEDEIQDGDEVIVYGKLTLYKETYEMTTGSEIYSLNGKTAGGEVEPGTDPETPYTVVGAGTLENPYTAADVAYLFKNESAPAEAVWVKGNILGNVNTQSGATVVPESADTAVDTNLSVGDEKANVSVQLPKGAIREAINIKEHFDYIGKEVWVYGVIQKYCGIGGIKSTSDYSLNGTDTSIKNVNYSPLTRNAVYTTSGVKVVNTDAIQRGVYIVDGQKKYVK